MATEWTDLIGIILAVVFGAAIGAEREMSGKAAGLRTNVLICVGAAVFTVISRKMGADENQSLTRIAAQIVTGVGFLGAGAIIRDRAGILGLTTAATIWVVASVGMACGAGLYGLGFLTTIIVVVVLIGLGKLENCLDRFRKNANPQSPVDDRQ